MLISITAPDNATLNAALVAIKLQQFAGAAPARWALTLGDDGVSASLDTSSTVWPTGLPAGVAVANVVPASVAMWQAKAALQAAGLLDAANAAVGAQNNPVLNAFWSSATTMDRASPTLASLATALNLTSAQVDQLFVTAGAIAL